MCACLVLLLLFANLPSCLFLRRFLFLSLLFYYRQQQFKSAYSGGKSPEPTLPINAYTVDYSDNKYCQKYQRCQYPCFHCFSDRIMCQKQGLTPAPRSLRKLTSAATFAFKLLFYYRVKFTCRPNSCLYYRYPTCKRHYPIIY